LIQECRIGRIASIVSRTTEAVRKAERVGRIPRSTRHGRFRYWREDQVPAICAAFGAPLPPTAAERLYQEALALLGIEPSSSPEETLKRLQDELAPAVKTILKAPDLSELLTSVQGGID